MRRLATLGVVAALISPMVTSGQNYSFGDWARDRGYSPADVMPEVVEAARAAIDSLEGARPVPEPSTLLLAIVTLGSFIGWRSWRQTTGSPFLVVLIVLSLLTTVLIPRAVANIYRWDNGELITEKDAVPGVDLSWMDLRYANLVGTNLTSADLSQADLSDARLTESDLTDADFREVTLTDADLSGAVVREASFIDTTSQGFTAEQLYSTASYKNDDLTGIDLGRKELTGWDFAGKNLSDANFKSATLTDANLSLSDLRGARGLATSSANTAGMIWPNGLVESLTLDARQILIIRDDNGYTPSAPWDDPRDPIPIAVDRVLGLDPVAALQMVFEDDDWASTISFEPGIPVSLDGTLELTFANGTRPADLVGTKFDVFKWDGVTPVGAFAEIVSDATTGWDTSSLYTTGDVTLLSAEMELADVNLDRALNGLDVDPFVNVLVSGSFQPEADVNQDGVVNGLDVDPFVTSLLALGGGAQKVPEPSTLVLTAVGLVGLLTHMRGRSAA